MLGTASCFRSKQAHRLRDVRMCSTLTSPGFLWNYQWGKHRKNMLRKREFPHSGLCVKNRKSIHVIIKQGCRNPPRGRNPTGFSYLPHLKLGLTLLKAVFCRGGQKSRLDFGPWGRGSDPAALNAREVNTLLKDALGLLNCAAFLHLYCSIHDMQMSLYNSMSSKILTIFLNNIVTFIKK